MYFSVSIMVGAFVFANLVVAVVVTNLVRTEIAVSLTDNDDDNCNTELLKPKHENGANVFSL